MNLAEQLRIAIEHAKAVMTAKAVEDGAEPHEAEPREDAVTVVTWCQPVYRDEDRQSDRGDRHGTIDRRVVVVEGADTGDGPSDSFVFVDGALFRHVEKPGALFAALVARGWLPLDRVFVPAEEPKALAEARLTLRGAANAFAEIPHDDERCRDDWKKALRELDRARGWYDEIETNGWSLWEKI